MYFIQRTLNQSFCCNTMIFFHKLLLQRATVYTDTDWDVAFLRHINDCFNTLCISDISRIDAYFIRSVFHRCDSQTIVEMNICYQWNMNLFLDFF